MLLALIICHLSVLVAANPFHKYPFVFLLDVGNEELEKTNSEQIRVSVPGGSVALRYPAIGNGDTIGHIRVSGIDFGTDLKANIVDGGPGYKYVVLVFMGNAGTPYDAVVTVQTVSDSVWNSQSIGTVVNSGVNLDQSEEEDANNSAEDLSDVEESNSVPGEISVQSSNAELMQSSSNVYSYADNESMDEDDDDDDPGNESKDSEGVSNEVYSDELASEESDEKVNSEEESNEKDIYTQYADDDDDQDDISYKVKGVDSDDETEDHDEDESSPKVGEYSSKYEEVQDHMNYGEEAYSKEKFQKESRPVYQEDPLDYEDPYAEPPAYDDDDVNSGSDKYRDSNNNNYIDSGESYAVAY